MNSVNTAVKSLNPNSAHSRDCLQTNRCIIWHWVRS